MGASQDRAVCVFGKDRGRRPSGAIPVGAASRQHLLVLNLREAGFRKGVGVGEEGRDAAGVQHHHRLAALDHTPMNQILQADERLAGVHRIEEDSLHLGHQGERLQAFRRGDAIALPRVLAVIHDLCLLDRARDS